MGYPKIAILIGFAGTIFFDQNDSVNDPTWPRIPSNEQRRGTPCVDNFPSETVGFANLCDFTQQGL
jgi:hypothetical protein